VTLLTLAYRNLWRRPARTALTAMSIGIAIGMAIALLALSSGIERTTHEGAQERGADLTVSQKDASDIFSGFVPDDFEAKIRAIPGVIGVSGELTMFAPVGDDRQVLTFGLAPGSHFWSEMPITEGRLPEPGERRVALLGQAIAETLGKKVGDTLTLFDQDMKVIAIIGYRAAVNRSAMMVPLADLQELAFREHQVTVYHIRLDPALGLKDSEALSDEIEKLGRVSVSPTDQLFARDRNVSVLRAISNATTIIAMTMAGLSVLNVLLMAVQERIRETGVMMAIGWSNRRIVATIVIEGMITGLLGSLIGIPLGYVACGYFEYLPTIGAYLLIQPSLETLAIAVFGALGLSALGSLYPAWRAVSHTPADALRRA
jgi:putative ABC transport system permease protein